MRAIQQQKSTGISIMLIKNTSANILNCVLSTRNNGLGQVLSRIGNKLLWQKENQGC